MRPCSRRIRATSRAGSPITRAGCGWRSRPTGSTPASCTGPPESDDWRHGRDLRLQGVRATPLLFTFDDKDAIYVSSNVGRTRRRSSTYDLEEREERAEAGLRAPRGGRLATCSTRKRKVRDRGGLRDRSARLPLLRRPRARIQAFLDEQLPGVREPARISSPGTRRVYIVHSRERPQPMGTYYLLDTGTSDGADRSCSRSHPWLDESRMAKMRSRSATRAGTV